MANVIIIDSETREANQMRGFLKEMNPDGQVKIFEQVDLFERQYLLASARQPDGEETEAEDDSDKDVRLSSIDLVIFKAKVIKGDVRQWVKNTQLKLKEKRFWPEGKKPRFIAVKYDDDGKAKSTFLSPSIDDLISLPLDRLLFLQKVEIVLNLPETTSPTFLFQQEVSNMHIEVAKQSRIEKLCDIGLAIRNPIPLNQGTSGHFHFKLPGKEEVTSTYGKVVKSEPNPDVPGQFLSYFIFFGCTRSMQTEVRKYLASQSNFRSFHSEDPQQFAFNPDNIFLTEEDTRIKEVAIIDTDPHVRDSITSLAKQEIAQTRIVSAATMFQFKTNFLEQADGSATASPLSQQDLFAPEVQFTINNKDQNFLEWKTAFIENDNQRVPFFGHDLKTQFDGNKDWLKLFSNKNTEGLLEEAIAIALKGTCTRLIMQIRDADDALKFSAVSIEHLENQIIQISMEPPTKEELANESKGDSHINTLDLLIVNSGIVGADVDEWLGEWHQELQRAGKVPADKKVPTIILGEKDEDVKPYLNSNICNFIPNPVDTKLTLVCMTAALRTPFSQYRLDNLGWAGALIYVNVAKEATLIQLSEFGATITHPRPITPGAPLFLHGGIYDNAPDGNLLARSYACEPDPEHKGQYLISLLYFGINDSFLKFTRNWVRENYAEKKEKQA